MPPGQLQSAKPVRASPYGVTQQEYMRRQTTTAATNNIPAKRRLALVAGTTVQPRDVLEMPDSDINYNFLLKHQIPVANIRVGGFTPAVLKSRGAINATALEALGFDALHLLNAEFLSGAVSAYGYEDLVITFLKTPYDAVALADQAVMQTLSLSIGRLMEECAGSPAEAVAVLHQLKSITALSITTLLDTGIRGPQLTELGYSYHEVQMATGANPVQMGKLQFSRPYRCGAGATGV